MIWEASKLYSEERIFVLASDFTFILKTIVFSHESDKNLSTFYKFINL